MLLSNLNIVFALRLLIKIWRKKPDVIRFHSTIRWIGRLGYIVAKLARKGAKRWMMFHDFGYFYPFPHALEDPEVVPLPLVRKTFVAAAGGGVLKKIFVWGKYIQLKMLSWAAKKSIDMFLVPSRYIVQIAEKSWEIEKNKVVVLEHFVQE